jgi:hypothetical protein
MNPQYALKRSNLKRKSKPYISFSPSLWGASNVFLSKTLSDIRLTYGGEEYAYVDLLALEQLYQIKCKIVNLDDEIKNCKKS